MTSTALHPEPRGRLRYEVTLVRVISSEVTKLRSVRSTWVMLLALTIVLVGSACAGGALYASWADADQFEPTPENAIQAPFLTFTLVALIMGCLGAISITGEYSTGAIRSTLTAVPKRLPVLWAKAIALVAVAGPVLLVANVVSYLGFQALAGSYRASFFDSRGLLVIVSATVLAAGFGLFGLGVGAALRSPIVSVAVLAALLFVGPILLASLPSSTLQAVGSRLPLAAATGIITNAPSGGLGQLAGDAIIAAGWVILVLAGGAALLHRRDP